MAQVVTFPGIIRKSSLIKLAKAVFRKKPKTMPKCGRWQKEKRQHN